MQFRVVREVVRRGKGRREGDEEVVPYGRAIIRIQTILH